MLTGPTSALMHPADNIAPFEEMLEAVASRLQHCVRFNRPKM